MKDTLSNEVGTMNEIAAAQRRATGYWFVDGLAEIAGGTATLLVGALLYLAVRTGVEGLATVAMGVLIVAFPVSAWVVRVLKERITYPRTGFVAYAPPSRARLFAAAAIAFLVAGLMVPLQVFARGGEVSAVVLEFGAAVGAVTAFRAWRTGAPRFYVVAAALVVASAILATNGAGIQDGIGLMLMFYGATLVVSGVWVLVHYLRANGSAEGGAA
jgi:hypothetical protein